MTPEKIDFDGVTRNGTTDLSDARRTNYHRLPYGPGIKDEWGALIYVNGGRFFVSDTIKSEDCKGPNCRVSWIIGITASGQAVTIRSMYGVDGQFPIQEFDHTHPDSGHPATDWMFSGYVGPGAGRVPAGDIPLAKATNVSMTLRSKDPQTHMDEIYLFNPQTMTGNRDRLGRYTNTPGVPVCSGDQCF
jgi:hypothetical protein